MIALFFSRRFFPIFGAMALGAFNDNFYKNAVIILITYALAAQLFVNAPLLISLAAACFILPFFLFSGIAGILADRVAKHRLVRYLKITELAICILAAIALFLQHAGVLMVVLFLFGTQSAFFGPVKYAILPELLPKNELLIANGMIEAGTFLGILIGTLLGGLLILEAHGVAWVSAVLILLSTAGVLAAYRVLPTTVTEPIPAARYKVLATTKDMLSHAARNPPIWYAILGISWFWAIGTTYLTQIPVFTKESIGGDEHVASFFLALFSIGIAFGSLSCAHLTRIFPRAPIAPLALAGITLAGLHVNWLVAGIAPPATLMGLTAYLENARHLAIAADLFLLAACGGIFIVPLYTQLQLQSKESERARAIASNNVMNALFSSIAAVLAAALYAAGMGVDTVFLLTALANIPVIYTLYRQSRAAG